MASKAEQIEEGGKRKLVSYINWGSNNSMPDG